MTRTENGSVLLPAKFSPSSYACLRSLSPRGVHTIVTSPHDVPAFASRYCDEAIIVPSAEEDLLAYKDALLSIAARPDVRTILPIWVTDAYVLSKYRAEFEEHVTAMWSSMNTLREVHDRMRLVETAEKLGIPVPETWLLNEVPDWNRELIVKSRYNILAEDYVDSLAPGECVVNKAVTYPEPGEEPDIETIRTKKEHTPIVQKVIPDVPGVEYAFRALYDHGELVTMGQKRQARGETYAGGASVYRESIDDPRLEELGRTLLDSLEWHGLASVQVFERRRYR